MLWADETNPDLDPVRHLLVFVYLLGSTSGYLFPDYTTLVTFFEDRGEGHISKPILYNTFLKTLQHACNRQLATDRPGATWGLHSLRKTGYLLAIWAGAPHAQILEAARHSSEKNSRLYSAGAATLKAIAEETGTFMHLDWKPPFVADRQHVRSLSRSSLYLPPQLRSVAALAKHFAESFCKYVKPDAVEDPDSAELGVTTLVRLATTLRTPQTEREKLFQFVDRLDLSASLKAEFAKLLTSFVIASRTAGSPSDASPQMDLPSAQSLGDDRQLVTNLNVSSASSSGGEAGLLPENAEVAATTASNAARMATDTVSSLHEEPVANKRKRVYGEEDLPGRKMLATMNGQDKLQLMLSIHEEVTKLSESAGGSKDKPILKGLTSAAKSFVNGQLNPVINCLTNHCGSDPVAFVGRFGNFSHTTFKKTCSEKCG